MTDNIQADYEAIESISARFIQQQEITEELRKRLSTQIDTLRAGQWVGQGADGFYTEMDHLVIPAIQRLSQAFETAADTVRQIGVEFQNAEEEARAAFAPTDDTGNGQQDGATNQKADGNTSAKTAPGNAATISSPSGRSGQQLNSLLDSFNVESNEKYRPGRNNATYCNVYVADVAHSISAPLPFYVTDNNNQVKWLDANLMTNWLEGSLSIPGNYSQGPQNGWQQVSHTDAIKAANDGYLVIAGGHGHMAAVRAGGNPGASLGDVPIAQAGGRNFASGAIKDGWGQYTSTVKFFVYSN